MAKYMIFEGFVDDLMKKLTRIQNKCRKYGIECKVELTGNEEIRTIKEKLEDGHVVEHHLRYVEVEAEGKAQINGWEWLASIESTEKGNIIRSAHDIEIPTKYYTSDCYCEHCNTNRWRKYLYLVKNVESGEIKQVGKSCLADYTHGLNADLIAQYRSLFTGLEEEEGREPSFDSLGFRDYEYLDIEELTRYIAETIRHYGFVPKSEDNNFEKNAKRPTAYLAEDLYDAYRKNTRRFTFCMKWYDELREMIERDHFDPESAEATQMAHDALAWIAEQDDSRSAYLHNLKLVCSLKEITRRHYGILASLIPTWNKSLVREAAREEKRKVEGSSKHVGKIGERTTFDIASTEVVTSWETDYGTMWLIKFVTTDGNVLMWRSSSIHNLPDDYSTIKKIVGTIKDHDEFRGVKQTFVNRCKVM